MALPRHSFDRYSSSLSSAGGRVLWMRVAIFGAALFVAFILGILIGSSGGSGVSQAQYSAMKQKYDGAQNQLSQAQSDLTNARNQVATSTTAAGDTGNSGTASDGSTASTPSTTTPKGSKASTTTTPNGSSTTTPSSTAPDGSQSYTAKGGDTLWKISVKFYGNGALWQTIATANGLDKNTSIKSGMKVVIPPKPSSSATTTTTGN